MKNIIDELMERGIIKDFSNKEKVYEMFNKPQTIYCGFDPSASSLHVGNYLMISVLMRMQQYGHRVIALVGGATGMIGDPSGKSKERAFLSSDTVMHNVECIKNQLSHFIDLEDSAKGKLVNNYDWYKDMDIITYYRNYGKLFNINYMLSKEIISSRLETGISFTEFSYMVLQSIDFLKLHETEGVNLQVGGSDQWGNLTAGLELIRKAKGDDEEVGCMVCNLITRSDGKKFGKSEDGAIFLDEKLTSPYKMYQFFLNSTDEDSIHYMKVFTFVPLEEIYEIEKEHLSHLGERIAQKRLAYEMVKIIHGEEKANEAIEMSKVLFTGNYSMLKEEQIIELFNNKMVEVNDNMLLEELLIKIEVAKSKREARDLINGNSISINGEKLTSLETMVSKSQALFNKYLVIKKGKKTFVLAKIN